MVGACSTRGRGENASIIWFENLKERNQLEDLGVDDKIILK
jgi:hypothetical protein